MCGAHKPREVLECDRLCALVCLVVLVWLWSWV